MNKKIFIVIGSLGLGGTEKQLFLKVKNLKKKYNFTIIFFYEKGELYEDFKKLGIKLIDLTDKNKNKLYKYIKVFIKLMIILKRNQPKIVHFYLPHAYLIGGWFSYVFTNINFLMSRRSLNFYQKKIPFVKFIEKRILHKKMKKILVNSYSIKKQLVEEESVVSSKIKVIYNLIEIKKNISKKENKVLKIIFLANLIPYKNHNMIIDVANSLPRNLKYEIQILGKGEERYTQSLKQKIKTNKIIDKFKFLGSIKNPNVILKKADIGIMCSNEEGLSNSILEYMSHYLPIIATNVGGNAEMIKNNFNGFLIKTNDHKDFARKLKMLIQNKNLRNKLGKNNLKLLKKKFVFKDNLDKHINVYNNLMF
tara:strand:- start:199 stop:1293 length:1095 start_codon:yes stop_codon:yes gene_type:complete